MARFSAQDIYGVVSKFDLTSEQISAIEHQDGSALVVAGAGSGKTELMSIRAMYLVANQMARPEQILGLTFTRKAAAELAIRISNGLFALRESSYWPSELGDEFQPPKIATYNSFGNEIFRTLALQLGYETDATLITEAASVALVKELLRDLDLESFQALGEYEKSESHLISLVLTAAGAMTDNLVGADEAVDVFDRFVELATSLPQANGKTEQLGYTKNHIALAEQNKLVFELAGEYQRLKASRDLVDFSDQIALAFKGLEKNHVQLDFSHVMLDEYQDTSAIQTMLLAKLFSAAQVMAVGDPNQSIYGWRGASSANLESFEEDFSSTATYSLSKSWRSSSAIVGAANEISSKLNSSGIASVMLTPGRQFSDRVVAAVFQDEVSEAKAVARWFTENLNPELSGAVLFRSKSAMGIFAQELSLAGLQIEVTGLSGLTETPEVIDLISALRVMIDPDAGVYLMRLLAGPRFRISARDLAKLHLWARRLSRLKKTGFDAPVTIIEALDQLRWQRNLSDLELSETALERMRAAAELLHNMRQNSSLNLTELAWLVVRELELDIELYAYSKAKNPLANLQAFISRISDYEQSSQRPSLRGLITWLEYALEHETFELPKSGAKAGVIQLMTVHASKGLEWDLVAVAGLVDGSFPVGSRDAAGWLSAGKLPFELRKDSLALPTLKLQVENQKELDNAIADFKVANRKHQLVEERRLAYVAFTRASQQLLLTAGYFKTGTKNPRPVSEFLTELIEAGAAELVGEIPIPEEQNPLAEQLESAQWPIDPLGSNRDRVATAAETVLSASPASLAESLELAALLEEQANPDFLVLPEIPARLSASKIVQLLTDPEGFFQQILRPMPQMFSDSARLGSEFHASLEKAFLEGSELDFSTWSEEQKELGQNFAQSKFATEKPFAVELPIEFSLGESVVVCKLDAVFETKNGFLIVDWKSGHTPKAEDLAARSIQLALYRIGLARFLGVGVERIEAAFYFAADNNEVRPDLAGEAELEQRLFELRRAPLPRS
ncbi:MAG: ATP-dependent helicase [Aquiluna sp.]|nr:ATP-dependent helicase [Aquiluna sp.]